MRIARCRSTSKLQGFPFFGHSATPAPKSPIETAIRPLDKPAPPTSLIHQGSSLFVKRLRLTEDFSPHAYVMEFGAMGGLFREDQGGLKSILQSGFEFWSHEFADEKGKKRVVRDLENRDAQCAERMALLDLFFSVVEPEKLKVLRTESFGLWHLLKIAQTRPDLLRRFHRIVILSPFLAIHADDKLGLRKFYTGHEQIFQDLQEGLATVARLPSIFSWVIPRLDIVSDFHASLKAYGQMPENRRNALVLHRSNHRVLQSDDNPDCEAFFAILNDLMRGKAPPENPSAYGYFRNLEMPEG